MRKLAEISDYIDEDGNTIESPTRFSKRVSVTFRGKNNRVIVDPSAKLKELLVVFDCDNGLLRIGPNSKHGFSMSIRIGEDAQVLVGADVTSTTRCIVSAVEGATVEFGDDVMLASQNQVRADDGHPIFDVETGQRMNPAKDIHIGNHVWLGAQAVVLGGADIGPGSVIGFGSIVTGRISNNCIAVGSPARMVRQNIAWERPHLSFVGPPYKPDSSTIEVNEEYWALTQNLEPEVVENLEPEQVQAITPARARVGSRKGFVSKILSRFGYERQT